MAVTTAEVTQLMKNFEVMCIAPQPKPAEKKGTSGTPVQLVTNLTKFDVTKSIPYFKYSVHMVIKFQGENREKELTKITKDDFLEQDRKALTVALYRALVNNQAYNGVFDSKKNLLLYDRAKVLFSTMKLNLGGTSKTFTLPPNFISHSLTEVVNFIVTVDAVAASFQATSDAVLRAANPDQKEADKTMLEVLNLAFAQSAFMQPEKFSSYGAGDHYLKAADTAPFNAGGGKEVKSGARLSVKVLEGPTGKGQAYILCHVRKSVFHKEGQNLLDKVLSYNFIRANLQQIPYNVPQLDKQLKDLHVKCDYGKGQEFFIKRISKTTASSEKIDGKGSVQQYFQKQYSISLRHANLPLVQKQGDAMFPMERLTVLPHQREVVGQTTGDVTRDFIKQSAMLPVDRLKDTINKKILLQVTPQNQYLVGAGIQLANELEKVNGRVLPTPTITTGSGPAAVQRNYQWGHGKPIKLAQITSVGIVGFFTPHDRSFDLQGFKEAFVRAMSYEGWNAQQMNAAIKTHSTSDLTDLGVQDAFRWAQSQNCQLMFCIVSDSSNVKGMIKLVECEIGTISAQCMKLSVANKFAGQKQTAQNVLMKINMKLGGLNYRVNMVTKHRPNGFDHANDDMKTFVMGFSIANPPPANQLDRPERDQKGKMPSVLAWGANSAEDPQYYLGGYKFVKANNMKVLGADIADAVLAAIKSAFDNRGKKVPTQIILFFKGITESLYLSLLRDDYVKAIIEKLNTGLSPKFTPTLTIIAVNNEHGEHIFKQNPTGQKAAEQNVTPGTVVDEKIVSPYFPEFYLNSHLSIQGSAHTPKYTVILNNNPVFNIDTIECYAHRLCFMHGIIDASESTIVPLVVAEDCATRGSDLWREYSTTRGQQLDADEANAKITYTGKDLGKRRFNA